MRAVIKVVVPRAGDEPEELVSVVPGSVKQATGIAEDYLAEHLSDETLAEVVTVTKSSLAGGLEKDAHGDAMVAFREAGAVTETFSESLREVRSGG